MNRIIKHKQQKGAVLPVVMVITGVAIITIILIWLLIWTKPQPQATLEQLAPLKVALIQVERRLVQPYDSITGRLQPIKTAQLRFEVAGKVVSRTVEPGTLVNKDSTLMKLDDSDYQDRLRQTSAELDIERKSVKRDKNLLKFANKNLQLQLQEEKRLEKLVERNLIAQSQLDDTRQRAFDLQAEVARLEYSVSTNNARMTMKQAQRDLAERNLVRATLNAPFPGVVNEVFLDEGDYVNANEIALTLVDASEFDVQLDVRGEVVSGLTLDQVVDVQINGIQSKGKVIAIQLDPDVNTNTHQVRVRVPRDHVQSGMLASVFMPLAIQSESTIIPVSAVLNQFGNSYVFVYENGVVEKTAIQLGRRIDNEVIVSSGIQKGQKIVARDVGSLTDQQNVTIE